MFIGVFALPLPDFRDGSLGPGLMGLWRMNMKAVPWVVLGTIWMSGCLISEELRLGAYDRDYDGHLHPIGGGDDCDDLDETVYPGADDPLGDDVDQDCDGIDGVDGDGDGFASVDGGGPDCDDGNPYWHPDATDTVGNNVDENCDGADGVDQDGDGAASLASDGDDCDDQNAFTFPGAADDVGNGADDNCDGLDGEDGDGDGFASTRSGGTDCDDGDGAIKPGAIDDVGDDVDENCDNVDGIDSDGDGHASQSSGGQDCDDAADNFYPGAVDTVGDGIDQSCDLVDGVDSDGDGVASEATGGTDCDDADAGLSPLATESCDGLDENCDDIPDDGLPMSTFFEDGDQDGFGSEVTTQACAAPPWFSEVGGDCDDADHMIYPGTVDNVGDGVDNNCDLVDGTDADGDLFASIQSGGLDCFDNSDSVHPLAVDTVGDSLDQNCDGVDGVDVDGDTWASVNSGGSDCNDFNRLVNPGVLDLVGDATDANCDGHDGVDGDSDGQASLASGGTDCDDSRGDVGLGMPEVPYDGVDQDCVDGDLTDVDGDGWDSDMIGGSDCNDDEEAIGPGLTDDVGDGLDNNCDGVDGTDGDGDGDPSLVTGGGDCDDQDAARASLHLEVLFDGVDQDCDGVDAAQIAWRTGSFALDSQTGDIADHPTVAWQPGGDRFLVGFDKAPSYAHGFGRVFEREGTPIHEEWMVDEDPTHTVHAQAAWLDASTPMLGWSDDLTMHVFARRFKIDGQALGDVVQVSDGASPFRDFTDVSVNDDGTVLMLWLMQNPLDSLAFYRIRSLSHTLAVQGPDTNVDLAALDTTIGGAPSIALSPNGQTLIVWEETADTEGYIAGAWHWQSGARNGLPFLISDNNPGYGRPEAAVDDSGAFVVTWSLQDDSGDIGLAGRYRVFEANNAPRTDILELPTGDANRPTVAAQEGVMVIGWEANDLDEEGIVVAAFAMDDGSALTEPVRVPEDPVGSQVRAGVDLTVLDGVVEGVVVYETHADTARAGAWGRRFAVGRVD